MRWFGVAGLVLGCATGATVTDGAVDDVARGRMAVARLGCPTCHDPGDGSLSGQTAPRPGTMAYGANLTPDVDTGLGGWSDQSIVRALRESVDDQGRMLCPPMPRFGDMADDEARAIVAFLRSLPPVYNDQVPPSSCGQIASDAGDLDGAFVVDAASSVDAIDAGSIDRTIDSGVADAGDCVPRINEVQTAGANGAEDEFVELFNPCDAQVALDGWRLVYRAAAGAVDVKLVDLAGPLAPGAFAVCGGKQYAGAAAFHYASGIASTGGGLALRDGAGDARDSLGWGTATNAFVRGSPAPAPPTGKSAARHPDGADSGDNGVDFAVSPPTPGAQNQ